MRFGRRHAWLLIAVAVWNVVTFGTFAKNLYAAWDGGEDRPAGYWIAHTLLIVGNFVIAYLLGRLGIEALRADRAAERSGSAGSEADLGRR